jgi:hypothetical protein
MLIVPRSKLKSKENRYNIEDIFFYFFPTKVSATDVCPTDVYPTDVSVT